MIYIESKSNDPRYNTALELYAFNELAKKDDVFMLWINSPCIVVGKNQNTTEEINQRFCDDNDIKIPSDVCDCNKAIDTVANCKDYDEFKANVKIRNIENILDMLDLYYRYHWACVDKSVNPKSNIGSLNPDVVMERRKGLEWLVSKADDWNDISLDT